LACLQFEPNLFPLRLSLVLSRGALASHLQDDAAVLLVKQVTAAPPDRAYRHRQAPDLVLGEEVTQPQLADQLALGAVDDHGVVAVAHAVPVVEGHNGGAAVADQGADRTDAVGKLLFPERRVRAVLLLLLQPADAPGLVPVRFGIPLVARRNGGETIRP